MNDLVVICLIFGNLMYSFWQDSRDNIDGNEAIRKSMEQYTSKVSKYETTRSSYKTRAKNVLPDISESDVGESFVEENHRSSRAEPMTKQERPPDSWARMNEFASSLQQSILEDVEKKKASSTVSEEEESFKCKPKHQQPLPASNLPKKAPTRFNYALDRIDRARRSHVSRDESSFSDGD